LNGRTEWIWNSECTLPDALSSCQDDFITFLVAFVTFLKFSAPAGGRRCQGERGIPEPSADGEDMPRKPLDKSCPDPTLSARRAGIALPFCHTASAGVRGRSRPLFVILRRRRIPFLAFLKKMNKVTTKVRSKDILESCNRFGVQLQQIWCPVTTKMVSSYNRFGVRNQGQL
jgi:hypothetical protein